MEKFLVLYMAPVASIDEMMKNMSPEQAKEGMDAWSTWMEEHAANFFDMGTLIGKTKRVTSSGVSDVKNEVTGYSIVQAESHEAAAQLFEDMPHFQIPGGYVEIMRMVKMEEVPST